MPCMVSCITDRRVGRGKLLQYIQAFEKALSEQNPSTFYYQISEGDINFSN